MKKILVAGIGSPFGADQLGWQVVDALQSDSRISECCELFKLDRPGAGLIETLQGYERVILIDAVQAGKPRGTLVELDIEQISEQATGLSSHNFGVAEAVALARAMGTLPDEIVLFGLDVGEGPDAPFVSGETEELVDRVVCELNEREVTPSPARDKSVGNGFEQP